MRSGKCRIIFVIVQDGMWGMTLGKRYARGCTAFGGFPREGFGPPRWGSRGFCCRKPGVAPWCVPLHGSTPGYYRSAPLGLVLLNYRCSSCLLKRFVKIRIRPTRPISPIFMCSGKLRCFPIPHSIPPRAITQNIRFFPYSIPFRPEQSRKTPDIFHP